MSVARLVVVDSGEDSLVHWLRIELRDPVTDEVLDRDRFRWGKKERQFVTNPYTPKLRPDGSVIPSAEDPDFQKWAPVYGSAREVNRIRVPKMVHSAAKHFLERQGVRAVPAQRVSEFTKRDSRPDVIDADSNASRIAKLKGGAFDVPLAFAGDPELRSVMGREGTVTSVPLDYDAYGYNGGKDDTGGYLFVQIGTYASAIKFDLTSVAGQVYNGTCYLRTRIRTVSGGSPYYCRAQAYEGDGYTYDPESDTSSTFYNRATGNTIFNFDSFSAADEDIEVSMSNATWQSVIDAAMANGGRFSLCPGGDGMPPSKQVSHYADEAGSSYDAELELNHADPPFNVPAAYRHYQSLRN